MKLAQFLTILLIAIALVPVGAHLFELPHKIAMDRDGYMIVQGIYRGWAIFGAVIIAALAMNIVLIFLSRSQPVPLLLAALAGFLILCTLVIFFTWTYPINQITNNWTVAGGNWRVLRAQWEYSHAANAGVTFLALVCATASALLWRAPDR
jgi:hypothetical protein